MTIKLSGQSYGKGEVRLTKVVREGARHAIHEYDVSVELSGAFEETYLTGENRDVIPTDTMRNTVYAVAAKTSFASPEELALALVRHFVDGFAHVAWAAARIAETPWARIEIGGRPHDHAFARAPGGLRTCSVRLDRGGVAQVRGGVTGLEVVKTTGSGFSGFLRDAYTTLKDTDDRIFGTSIEAVWTYAPGPADYAAVHEEACRRLLEIFALNHSLSVQQTLHEMGVRLLERIPALQQVEITMPNRHRIAFDLAPLGLPNTASIFVNTREPYGLIKGTIARGEP